MQKRTIGLVLDENRGLGLGFDFLRVALAFGVVAWHINDIAEAGNWQHVAHFLWINDYWILQVFFGLSGFLIAGSALRLSLSNFLLNRGLRIFPALAVEIVFSALVIGPAFTTLPLSKYFSNPDVYHYFTNILAVINFQLPGVFKESVRTEVNAPLWTVPYEMGCYGIMAVFIQFSLLKRRWVPLIIAIVAMIIGMGMVLSGYHPPAVGHIQARLEPIFYANGSRLYVAFCLGIAAYLFRYKIPYSFKWFGISLAFMVLVAGVGHGDAAQAFGDPLTVPNAYPFPPMDVLISFPLTYIMAFLGLTRFPKLPIFRHGDYSYGIYLYGWPVTQVIVHLFPWMRHQTLVLFLATAISVTAFAAFSWHLIELPILKQRRKFSFVARQRLAESAPDPALAGAKFDRPVIGDRGQ